MEDPTWSYSYDNEGNLVTKTHKTTGDVWSFSYDHLNRLVAATLRNSLNQVSKDARYAYDVFGQRIEKKVDGDGNGTFEQVSRSAYLDGMAFADFDGATTLTTRYFAGDHIDELLARISASGTVAWYLTDNLGSVRHLVDNTGSTIATLSYDSFDKLTSAEDPDSDRFRFTGREYDAETGLYYYRARYYDPNTGRFLEQDPIGFAAGDANLYRYVGNSPTNGTDPSGLEDTLQPVWDFFAGMFVSPPPGYSKPAEHGATVPVRIGGGVQTIGGAGQVLIGGGLILAPDSTAMTKIGGVIIAGKGVDNMNAGIAAMLSGKPQKTATAQTFGDGTDFALDLLGPTAAGLRSWMRQPCPPGLPGLSGPANKPVGSSRAPLGEGVLGSNAPTTIGGRWYSGHAIDRMQQRGIPPSVVENTIKYGGRGPGSAPGTIVHFDPINNVSAVVDPATGRVVTVSFGDLR